MKRNMAIFQVFLTLLLFSACVPKESRQKDALSASYFEKAQAYESQGNLNEALKQYKLALTAAPKNSDAKKNISRLEKKLFDLAEKHYQLGLKYWDAGKYNLAKKNFLIALKYRPKHKKAAKMLSKRRKKADAQKFVYHVIKPGESLSKLAKKYYGDYKKFNIIADFNNMPDATQVKVGDKIMIPEIKGVKLQDAESDGFPSDQAYIFHTIKPGESISKIAKKYYGDYKLFHVIADFNDMQDATKVKVGQTIKIPRISEMVEKPEVIASKPDETDVSKPETEPAQEPEDAEAPPALPADDKSIAVIENGTYDNGLNEQVAGYLEMGIQLYNEKKYDEAVVELEKALSAKPDDENAKQHLVLSYVEIGKSMMDEKNFENAKMKFQTALEYDPDCKACGDLIKACDGQTAEDLFTYGVQLFNSNRYDEAASAFENALDKDDRNEKAMDYLSRSLYQQAMVQFNNQDYIGAVKGFESALKYDPNCDKCEAYREKSLDIYKETHYNNGIAYFGQENLEEAINEWTLVSEIDPDYKEVRQNIRKATLLKERLDNIKKSSSD